MHVLVVPSFYPTDLNPIGGQFFRDQVLGLKHYGLEVGVAYANARSLRRGMTLPGLLTHRFQAAAGDECGIPTLRVLSWNMLGQFTLGGLMNGALLAKAARHYIARYGTPDVIHAHQARWAGYGAMLAAREHGLPYVVTEHESYFAEGKIPDNDKPYLRDIYREASRVIAVSRAMSAAMHDVYDPGQITIIPNMVNTDYFDLPARPRPVDPFVFLCVARLAKVKCLDLLLRAFARAFPGDAPQQLRIVGDGPEDRALRQLARDLHVAHRVHFCGELFHDGVLAELHRAHVFVLCSAVETFGVVLIEALSCGVPVIATRCGGPEDIVTPDCGVLVDCDNVAQLAEAMQRLHAQYRQYDPAALHAQMVARFSDAAVAARLAGIYETVCGGCRI